MEEAVDIQSKCIFVSSMVHVCITYMKLSFTPSLWGHLQGDMHMVAVVAGCKNALVGTGLAYSCLGSTNGLTKCYSHFVGGSFLTVKAIWVLMGV